MTAVVSGVIVATLLALAGAAYAQPASPEETRA